MSELQALTAKQIFEDHLLLDKKVTMQFSSLQDSEFFYSALRSYKSRYNKIMETISPELSENRVVIKTKVPSLNWCYSFSLGPKEQTKFMVMSSEFIHNADNI